MNSLQGYWSYHLFLWGYPSLAVLLLAAPTFRTCSQSPICSKLQGQRTLLPVADFLWCSPKTEQLHSPDSAGCWLRAVLSHTLPPPAQLDPGTRVPAEVCVPARLLEGLGQGFCTLGSHDGDTDASKEASNLC